MITTALATICLLQPADDAKKVFLDTMSNYAKLDSLSVDIEHDNSSGLFPGKYHQHLDFKKGKGFKFVVTGLHGSERPDGVASDYYCDGVDVTTVGKFAGVKPIIHSDSSGSPGYEVSGGMVMTWLLDSPSKQFFSKPPEGMEIQLASGQRTKWKDLKVSEIVITVKMKGRDEKIALSAFLDSERKKLVGYEWKPNGKTGWMIYKNQKDNAPVNTTSFKPPRS